MKDYCRRTSGKGSPALFPGMAPADSGQAQESLPAHRPTPVENLLLPAHPWAGKLQGHLLTNGFMHGHTQWMSDDGAEVNGATAAVGKNGRQEGGHHDIDDDEEFVAHDDNLDDDNNLDDDDDERGHGLGESRLRVALDVLQMKVKHGWTDRSVDDLLAYVKDLLPAGNTCPGSLAEAKRITCPLDLPHENWYKKGKKKAPRKVVWYFPLAPRLQRFYADRKEAKLMRWHAERKEAVLNDKERIEHPVLTHPSDASQWKALDNEFGSFGADPRNIREQWQADDAEIYREHNSSFARWFKDHIDANPPPMDSDKDKLVLALSHGPAPNIMTYQAYDINGYTFYTEEKDKNSVYQNSGVTMDSWTGDVKTRYYGRIEEIWELSYAGEKVPMFRIRWAKSVTKEDRYFTTMFLPEANKSKSTNATAQNEPWVLAEHVHQCFFITDPSRPSRVIVRRGKRTIVGMDGVANEEDFEGQVGDPMMEEFEDEDTTYTTRRSRTTLQRSGRPFKRRSHDTGLNYSTTSKKSKKKAKHSSQSMM
ncbi:hypothetical protein QYE76_046907 [Lolium multiflorum]|uniref:Uncharacterized protein n=1 Tax=Lolium multiflorum TaxID=4521 RepID=A0AAD8WZM2_LOLMU|nr:hypothetical protein QYE76_046907 [Lolium multiflorum]